MPAPVKTGRAVPGIYVRPRTSEQADVLEAARAKASEVGGRKISLPEYVLESALMVAAEEGFSVPAKPPPWRPARVKRA